MVPLGKDIYLGPPPASLSGMPVIMTEPSSFESISWSLHSLRSSLRNGIDIHCCVSKLPTCCNLAKHFPLNLEILQNKTCLSKNPEIKTFCLEKFCNSSFLMKLLTMPCIQNDWAINYWWQLTTKLEVAWKFPSKFVLLSLDLKTQDSACHVIIDWQHLSSWRSPPKLLNVWRHHACRGCTRFEGTTPASHAKVVHFYSNQPYPSLRYSSAKSQVAN